MFKNILYSLFTKGFVAIINFCVFIVSSRYLGVSSRGEISIFLLNITIIQVINEIYTGYSIVHFVPKYDLKKIVINGLLYTLAFCVFSNSLVLALHRQVGGNNWLGYVISGIVLLNTFFCVLILSKENIRLYSFLSFLQPLLLLLGLLFFIFILHEYTIKAYVFPLLISFFVATCVSAFKVLKYVLNETPGKSFSTGPILWNGLIYQLGLLLFIFVNKFSYYLLPDIANVGLYSSACSLIESVLIIANGVGPVLLARVANEPKSEQNVRLTLSLSKLSFMISCFVLGIIFLIPESAFLRILGPGFNGLKESMMVYAPGVLLVSFFITIANYFNAIGRQRIVFFCYGAGAISTLILAPVLIKKYGVVGAALTANSSYLIISIAMSLAFFIYGELSIKNLIGPFEGFSKWKDLLLPKAKTTNR